MRDDIHTFKKVIKIIPMGKPRMTQRDKWQKRPCVLRYRAFKDELRAQVGPLPIDPFYVRFMAFFPMPKSWSKKKKKEMTGKLHRSKPDIDNICKAILDTILKDDSKIGWVEMSKHWDDGSGPRIILEIQ